MQDLPFHGGLRFLSSTDQHRLSGACGPLNEDPSGSVRWESDCRSVLSSVDLKAAPMPGNSSALRKHRPLTRRWSHTNCRIPEWSQLERRACPETAIADPICSGRGQGRCGWWVENGSSLLCSGRCWVDGLGCQPRTNISCTQ